MKVTALERRYGRARGQVLDAAIRRATESAQIMAQASPADARVAIVRDSRSGTYRYYNVNAWDRGAQPNAALPWRPPPFPKTAIIAIVGPDGSWEKGPAYS